jgi:hypothetical protein
MRKAVLVLGVAALLAAPLISQEKAKAMAIGIDAMPLLKGFIWSDSDAKNSQFAVSPYVDLLHFMPNFTLGIGGDLYFGELGDAGQTYIGVQAHIRWYAFSTEMDKLYLDWGVGFTHLQVKGDPEPDPIQGLATSLKIGYRLAFIDKIFLEPSMSYVYAKEAGGFPVPIGWQPGVLFGMLL